MTRESLTKPWAVGVFAPAVKPAVEKQRKRARVTNVSRGAPVEPDHLSFDSSYAAPSLSSTMPLINDSSGSRIPSPPLWLSFASPTMTNNLCLDCGALNNIFFFNPRSILNVISAGISTNVHGRVYHASTTMANMEHPNGGICFVEAARVEYIQFTVCSPRFR